jgi:hypothetical protein
MYQLVNHTDVQKSEYNTELIIMSFIQLLNTGVRVMMLNATFNNISVISWPSALLVEET